MDVTYVRQSVKGVTSMPSKKKSTRKRLQRVSVRAELRDEPDWDRFAWALLQYARILSANEQTKGKSPRGKSKS